jgi:hypothetical protein
VRVTRLALVTLGVFIVLGVVGVATARFFGKSGSRLSVLVAVVASWLGAYVLWSFATAMAARYGVVTADEPAWFALFALAAGWWHYRVRVLAGRDRALVVFVGAQLVWLLVLLYRNGVLTP